MIPNNLQILLKLHLQVFDRKLLLFCLAVQKLLELLEALLLLVLHHLLLVREDVVYELLSKTNSCQQF